MVIFQIGCLYGTLLDMLITYFPINLIYFPLQSFHHGLRIGLLWEGQVCL